MNVVCVLCSYSAFLIMILHSNSLTGDVIVSPVCSVCRRFLQLHEQHGERLYEVEAPGGWTQRRNIWLNIQLGRYSSGRDYVRFYVEHEKIILI